ncbi:MAG TPA: rod shape-determining protein MreD [Alphaproteobacteria bacterium]|nr:rod shape-determining protein MreD [Alphaproteobacteria bacterium]
MRLSLPVLVTLAGAILVSVPYGMPRVAMLSPILALISVYYWSVYRPALMPAPAAFLIGVFIDLLGGGPLGVGAVVLVLARWVALSQRRALIGKSFAIGWLGYMLIGGAATLAGWLTVCIYHLQLIDPSPAVLSYGLGLLIYPVLAQGLVRVQQLTMAA